MTVDRVPWFSGQEEQVASTEGRVDEHCCIVGGLYVSGPPSFPVLAL